MTRSFRFSGAVHLGSDCRDSTASFLHRYSILASQCQGLKVNSTQLVLMSNVPGDKNCSLLSLRSMYSKCLSPWNTAGGTISNLFFCRNMWVKLPERLKAFTSRDWILFWSKLSLSRAGWASKHPTGSSSSLFCERCRTFSWLRLWSWGIGNFTRWFPDKSNQVILLLLGNQSGWMLEMRLSFNTRLRSGAWWKTYAGSSRSSLSEHSLDKS